MGLVGRGEKEKRVTGNILTMEPEWCVSFKTSEAFDVSKSKEAGQGYCSIQVVH